jgi:predicted RNA-binding Zn-ribbon protein involved in translation (DUF1610 family)
MEGKGPTQVKCVAMPAICPNCGKMPSTPPDPKIMADTFKHGKLDLGGNALIDVQVNICPHCGFIRIFRNPNK